MGWAPCSFPGLRGVVLFVDPTKLWNNGCFAAQHRRVHFTSEHHSRPPTQTGRPSPVWERDAPTVGTLIVVLLAPDFGASTKIGPPVSRRHCPKRDSAVKIFDASLPPAHPASISRGPPSPGVGERFRPARALTSGEELPGSLQMSPRLTNEPPDPCPLSLRLSGEPTVLVSVLVLRLPAPAPRDSFCGFSHDPPPPGTPGLLRTTSFPTIAWPPSLTSTCCTVTVWWPLLR